MDLVLARFSVEKNKREGEELTAPDQEKGDLIQLLSHANEERVEELKTNFLHWEMHEHCDLQPSCWRYVTNQ